MSFGNHEKEVNDEISTHTMSHRPKLVLSGPESPRVSGMPSKTKFEENKIKTFDPEIYTTGSNEPEIENELPVQTPSAEKANQIVEEAIREARKKEIKERVNCNLV